MWPHFAFENERKEKKNRKTLKVSVNPFLWARYFRSNEKFAGFRKTHSHPCVPTQTTH